MAEQQQQSEPGAIGEWVNLRDDRGHVQATFHPALMLLIIKERGKKTMHDLRKFMAGDCENSTRVLG